MKKSLCIFLSIVLVYSSCNMGSGNSEKKIAKGGKVYGGALRVNERESYQSLLPSSIVDVISTHIANQIYEGLVKFNAKDLSIMPSLAEKWEIDAAGTSYVFHLKKGVKFQDNECFSGNKGRELIASDVKFSFELLCVDTKSNFNFASTFKDCIVGANKFFQASKGKPNGEIEGISIIDDHTIKITLTAPNSSFLYTLASPSTSIIAKESFEKYGEDTKVGTGAFVFVVNSGSDNTILVRNDNYHNTDSLGNQLPFLDSIIISNFKTKKEEIENFKNGALHAIIELPSESVKDLIEKEIEDFQNKKPKFILERLPEMSSQYYLFNTSKAPFNNVKVRKAFSYAINKNKIIDDVLKGSAYGPGINGISPPTIRGYDISKITGYDFNPEEAKKLLAEAGYPNGKGFPEVRVILNSGSVKGADVVLEIQEQLQKVLNVKIDFEIVESLKQKLENEKLGLSELYRASWIADFPSPESFLELFYGANVPDDNSLPSWPNTSRYKNPEFDKLFDAGKSAANKDESFANYMKAEQLLMEDAPIIPLWYGENYRLLKSNVHSFFSNPMRIRDYSLVYLKD